MWCNTVAFFIPCMSTLALLFRRGITASRSSAILPLHRARPNRADRGLWGGAIKQFGNNRPKFGHRTRRTWDPNVHRKRLWSDILQRFVRINVTTRVLRWMDKVGGLDNYLLKTRDDKIDSIKGNKIKMQLLQELEKRAISGATSTQIDQDAEMKQ